MVSVRTSSGYSLLPLLLRVVTCSACFGDQYCFVWGGAWALVLRSHLRYRVEAVVGREEPSSRLDVIVRPLYIMQHAPDGSPIGRVLRVLLLKEAGEMPRGSLLAIRLGRGRGGDGWY